MIVAHRPIEIISPSPDLATDSFASGRPQQALIILASMVRNLHTEEDVQCVAFLACEFGILHPSPFYFSLGGEGGSPLPRSHVLASTLNALIDSGRLIWESGSLHAYALDVEPIDRENGLYQKMVWIATLLPREREALALVTLELHKAGIRPLSPKAETLFRRALTRVLGGAETAEVTARRLSMVRNQLGVV